ncbi:MAG: LUD domain-containing protein [Bacteroidota bacterium]
MGARETILNAVTANKPALIDLPDIDISVSVRYQDVVGKFTSMVDAAGGKAFYQHSTDTVRKDITREDLPENFVINLLDQPDSRDWASLRAADLSTLDTCYLQAQLGVAENGAMWVSEAQMSNRLLPFICQHLVIVVNSSNIVNNMHEAYQKINTLSDGFGVFIAGPSKTADIEQNLVIGAHGARTLRVYLIDDKIFNET